MKSKPKFGEWIPVSRKPKKEAHYLIMAGENMRITISFFKKGRWIGLLHDWTDFVTHWMPFPKPPKTKTKKGK